MQASRTRQEALAPQFGIALVFGLGGLTVCIPVFLVLWFLANMAGWGDGATGNAISNPTLFAVLLVLPLALYFILGIIAAITPRRALRRTLSIIATIIIIINSLFFGYMFLPISPFAIIGLFAIVYFFSICWRRLTR